MFEPEDLVGPNYFRENPPGTIAKTSKPTVEAFTVKDVTLMGATYGAAAGGISNVHRSALLFSRSVARHSVVGAFGMGAMGAILSRRSFR